MPQGVRLSPNLERPRVFFDAELRFPIRFREAMSALHEVVVGDLRPPEKDRSAYEAYQTAIAREEQDLRQLVRARETDEIIARTTREPMPPGLPDAFKKAHHKYFDARSRWIRALRARDSKLWWLLDPVITVAPDSVFFECFSKDESSYGVLHVDRGAFVGGDRGELGTTNVDYSFALYDHFQTLRSYRPTRLQVDPSGFEVQVTGHPDYREEKVDLPPSWLQGFGQIQTAHMIPSRKVELSVQTVYGLLAFLVRHREKTGPRSIRFELTPGEHPKVVLEPWGRILPTAACPAYDGPLKETVKVWGRRRLSVLARLLPLAERFEVHLLGSGLPSIWIAHMGEMRFSLCLSGWTKNDWTRGVQLDLLSGHWSKSSAVEARVAQTLRKEQVMTLASLKTAVGSEDIGGALHALAQKGQVIFDHGAGRVRYRQALPPEIATQLIPDPHPEWAAAQELLSKGAARVDRNEVLGDGRRLMVGQVGKTSVEALIDADGVFRRARCTCSFFRRTKLKAGPCRHLLALRLSSSSQPLGPSERRSPP